MSLPFTTYQFLEIFAKYNVGVCPAQLAIFGLLAAGLVATMLILLRNTRARLSLDANGKRNLR
jgi:hypothetical protein